MKRTVPLTYFRNLLAAGPHSLVGGPSLDRFSALDPLADFSLSTMGLQQCVPGHRWAGVRRHPILHFVLSGRGHFSGPHGSGTLDAGTAFFMAPGQSYRYAADGENPWLYLWVELRGRRVASWLERAGLTVKTPLWQERTVDDGPAGPAKQRWFRQISPHLRDLWESLASPILHRGLAADAHLHHLLVALVKFGHPAEPPKVSGRRLSHVKRVLEFIHHQGFQDIAVSRLADQVGLHRSRLAALFRKETGMSVKAYLTRHRMDEACRLLSETDLSVAEVADSVGYPSYVAFAIRFKARVRMSPLHWRERHRCLKGEAKDPV